MSKKAIVLDANILIRAVLGKRVRELIVDNANAVQFFAPDVAYADARKYLPSLLEKRGVKSGPVIFVGFITPNWRHRGCDRFGENHPIFRCAAKGS